MEYPQLGGANTGQRRLSIPKPELLAMMKRDVETLNRLMG
jgi:hypothetical protein